MWEGGSVGSGWPRPQTPSPPSPGVPQHKSAVSLTLSNCALQHPFEIKDIKRNLSNCGTHLFDSEVHVLPSCKRYYHCTYCTVFPCGFIHVSFVVSYRNHCHLHPIKW